MHFSEIIKFQLGQKCHALHALYLSTFQNCCFIICKRNAWLLPIFFLDSNSPCKDLLSPHSHKLRKDASVIVGTVLKYPILQLCAK